MATQIAERVFVDTNIWVKLLSVGDTRGKQVHDANIVATMVAHEIRILLTVNSRDFSRRAHLIEVRGL
jgi:predicted nucleic acid-binding protein